MPEPSRAVRASRGLGALTLAAALLASPLAGQTTVAEMAGECAGLAPDPVLGALCADGALALAAARASVGLAASQGSAVPGSASTLGRRVASSPRIAVSLRAGTARGRIADPGDGTAAPSEASVWPRTLEGGLVVGALEGWSLVPTVGGFLSLDLLGSLAWVGLPGDAGFARSVQAIGYGARLGVFRESFTLPGVSVSLVRRHLGEVDWGAAAADDGAHARFRATVTSLRATAAKDLLSLGVLGGWGWERYGGRSELSARRTLLGATHAGQAASDDFTTDRQMVFGGLSYTLLVLQLSAEGGWAGGHDAGAGSFFGSLAARVTY